jgi:hypothetical protein
LSVIDRSVFSQCSSLSSIFIPSHLRHHFTDYSEQVRVDVDGPEKDGVGDNSRRFISDS